VIVIKYSQREVVTEGGGINWREFISGMKIDERAARAKYRSAAKAAIIDQLYSLQPDEAFIQEVTEVLEVP